MGSEGGLVFATQRIGYLARQTAEDGTVGINDPPLTALDIYFGKESLHATRKRNGIPTKRGGRVNGFSGKIL
jgi:hypothetical protein